MLPCFVSLDGNTPFRLDDPLTVVGRARACEVHLDSSRVSRRHCCLAFGNGQVLVRDLGSTNGTWINGHRIAEATLLPGDVLGIAHLRFRFIFLGRIEDQVSIETLRGDDGRRDEACLIEPKGAGGVAASAPGPAGDTNGRSGHGLAEH
jgi:pSer/pThr/pTyr-binding forkhead associated (FHA) protein